MISDNDDGIIVDVNNSNELVDAINFLVRTPGEITRLGEKAREKVSNKYSQKSQLNQVIKLLRDS